MSELNNLRMKLYKLKLYSSIYYLLLAKTVMKDLNLIANTLGILSLLASIVALTPALAGLLKTSFRFKKSLLKLARIGIMATVCLGLSHGLLTTQQANIDFYQIETYWMYAGGLFAFNLFTFLAFSFAELKSNSRKLDYFSYGALFLLACHVGQQLVSSF